MAKKTIREDDGRRFFEIVNWKKAQPTIGKVKSADWMKLYTSLLDHEGYRGMDYTSRNLIVALWLYAARTGLHILPADPQWLFEHIPLLKEPPDLVPLFGAKDVYGNPTPFIAYCKTPAPKARNSTLQKRRQKRTEEKREETREERTLTGSGEKKQKRKRRVPKTETKQQKMKPQEPENPKESEAGAGRRHNVPAPPSSVNTGPQAVEQVIRARFPDHWQDGDAEAFGWEICDAMGLPHNENDIDIRSQWGAFASFWVRVKRAAPPVLQAEIRRIAVNKAFFAASNKAKSARNRMAVWTNIMYGELAARGVKLESIRAGP